VLLKLFFSRTPVTIHNMYA